MRARSLLPLIAAAMLAGCRSGAPAPDTPARFLGETAWQMPAASFGGFSGLLLDREGRRFLAVSDHGVLYSGRLRRQGAAMTVVRGRAEGPLRRRDGRPATGAFRDSESLARAGDGAFYVGFERIHRVARYARPGVPAMPVPGPAGFARFGGNAGLEALATGPDGALYALPEGRHADPVTPVWRRKAAHWQQPFALTRPGRFVPVGADFGPEGRLYVLERDFLFPLGFRSRVRRFTLGPDGARAEETLLVTPRRRHGDLEGLAVWRDAGGGIRLTMIEDDNFLPLLATHLVEYRVPPALESAAAGR